MPKSLGQIVYLFKDNLANELNKTGCHTAAMPQRAPRLPQNQPVERPKLLWIPPAKDLFARTLATRITEAREGKKLTQEEMADRLGIRQSVYSKYENRGGDKRPTAMPHIFLARFCELTGAKLEDLLRDPR